MKTAPFLIVLSVFFFQFPLLFSQEDCKVLDTDINESYQGGCKKGLAHGKGIATGIDRYEGEFKKGLPHGHGIYSWENGDIYDGNWFKGKMDGFGTLSFFENKENKVLAGIWDMGEYKGPAPKKPKVIQSWHVEKHDFYRLGDGNKVVIEIFMNGKTNLEIEDLLVFGDSGEEFMRGNSCGYEHVQFPFHGKVTYRTWNKLHTIQHNVIFEFIIHDTGDWKVRITN